MIKAVAKIWRTKDGKSLVPDGHKDAAILFARKGQDVKEAHVAQFPNAADFFAGLEKPKEPEVIEPRKKK